MDTFRFSPRPNRAHEIAWRPWGEEVFAESERSGKPVLLAISAVWCHWCHVMDETTYSDPVIIAAINGSMIPVRVDNDRRPDVNRRYNMGGWPTTAFLSARGEVIDGATYLAPQQMDYALRRMAEFYSERREELLTHDFRVVSRGGGEPQVPGVLEPRETGEQAPADEPSRATVTTITETIIAAADTQHGGLGLEPKFPQADAIALLVARAARGDGRAARTALAATRAMAAGEIHDRVGGGFFRYATRRDWSVPHYEKMLEDNARLAMLYLDAATLSGGAGPDAALKVADSAEAAVAADAIDYMVSTLRSPHPPLFAGSQDADEHYYTLDAAGREALAAPVIDATFFVDWNALAVRALLRGSYLLERPELARAALETLDHLWDNCHGRHGMRHYLGGSVDGLLADQAAMTAALLDAYEVSGERVYLARAEVLANWVEEHLSQADGRLADRRSSTVDAGLLAVPAPALDDNALMADDLLRLAEYSGETHFHRRAHEVLRAWADEWPAYGVAAGTYALALARALEHPTHIVVVGERADARSQALLRAALRAVAPQRTVQLLDPAMDVQRIVAGDYAITGPPVAYVCVGATCREPTEDPEQIAALVGAALAAGA